MLLQSTVFVRQSKAHTHSFVHSLPSARRYFTGTPLFSFGTGLSYSKFGISCTASSSTASYATGDTTTISCHVNNVGGAPVGDEVLMMYHSVGDDIRAAANHPCPIKVRLHLFLVRCPPSSLKSTLFSSLCTFSSLCSLSSPSSL